MPKQNDRKKSSKGKSDRTATPDDERKASGPIIPKHIGRDDLLRPLLVKPGKRCDLTKYDTRYTWDFVDEDEAEDQLREDIEALTGLQERLYAQDQYALLIILQALDAAGKDSVIKHVMSGVNPQGCQVYSFKQPSPEELDHTFLWRVQKAVPERGRIGIFNRSHYEECLVVRVHPEILEAQRLPPETLGEGLWKRRFAEINAFEHHLSNNGTKIVKIFLNVSKEEQRERFLARIDDPAKNWKFSAGDVEERKYWDDYQRAFEAVLSETSTEWAPWYVVPADRKWFARLAFAAIVKYAMMDLNPQFPTLGEEEQAALASSREALLAGA